MRSRARTVGKAALAAAARRLGLAHWAVPAAVLAYKALRLLLLRPPRRQPDAGVAVTQGDKALEDVLLPPSDRVFEMYDEDAVESMQRAVDDHMAVAEVMQRCAGPQRHTAAPGGCTAAASRSSGSRRAAEI